MNHSGSNTRRCETLALYLVENNSTVRDTAVHFGISKSTVHKDITEKLRRSNHELYKKAARVLKQNKLERHLRGGMATKQKYLELKTKCKNNF